MKRICIVYAIYITPTDTSLIVSWFEAVALDVVSRIFLPYRVACSVCELDQLETCGENSSLCWLRVRFPSMALTFKHIHIFCSFLSLNLWFV